MKKVFFILFSILIIVIFVLMSYYKPLNHYEGEYVGDEDVTYYKDEQETRILEKAEENAINYMKNKYGFVPKFTDKKADFEIIGEDVPGPIIINAKEEYTGEVLLRFEENNKEYYVLISEVNDSFEGYDNYQYEEIQSKIMDEFYSITQIVPNNYEIRYGKYIAVGGLEADNLVNMYFDDKNLKSVVSESKILIEYGENIDLNLVNTDFLEDDSVILLLKYKSEEDYEQMKKDIVDEKNNATTWIESFFIDNIKLIHIDEYLVIEEGNKEIKKVICNKFDDIYAICLEDNISFNISKAESNFVLDFYKYNVYDILSDCYNFDVSRDGGEYLQEDYILFFPINKLKNIRKYQENSWNDNFGFIIQAEDKSTGKVQIRDKIGWTTGMNIVHYENNEYLMLELSSYYPQYYNNIKFLVVGQPYKENKNTNNTDDVIYSIENNEL